VWIKGRMDSTGTLLRAQLVGASLTPVREWLARWRLNAPSPTFEFELDWTRTAWDADTAVELTTTSTGDAIYNHDDADSGHNNYVDIAAASILGTAPGPVELQIKNTYASNTLGPIYVGINQHKGTAMPVHVLEGEAATGLTETDDAGGIVSSGAHYGLFQLNGTAQQLAARWALDATALGKFAGHWYHVILRTPLSNLNIYAQLKTMYTGTTNEIGVATPEVLMTADELQDLGCIQLPPNLESETDLYTIDVCLYVRGADDDWFACDRLELMATDCWRKYTPISGGISQNWVLHDDSSIGRVWVDGISSTQRSAHYVAEGKPLMLIPGQDARIHVVEGNTIAGSEIMRTSTVFLWHRPRYLTL
jgi:hypothetical protein